MGTKDKHKFYLEGSKRKSKASGQQRGDLNGGVLAGLAYDQGTSIVLPIKQRGMLPVLGRNPRYKTIITERINDGSDSNRTVFNADDFERLPYFLDTDKLFRPSWKSSTIQVVPTIENTDGFILPDGAVLTNTSSKELFFDAIKPALDAKGYTEWTGAVPIPNEHRGSFSGYSYVYIKTSGAARVQVAFPDGTITEIQDLELKSEVYGDKPEYDSSTVFVELQKFDAIEFVKQNAPLGMFPETSKSPSYQSEIIYNGIIEPFAIREKLYGKEIFAQWDRKPGELNGEPTDPIEFSYSAVEAAKSAFAMYEDVAIAKTPEGFFEEKYISETVYQPDAYIDRDSYDAIYVDEELENVLISMDSTLDEGVLPVQHVDMTVGFDGIAKDRFGSIIYRGWLR